jgi:hypothetical protein
MYILIRLLIIVVVGILFYIIIKALKLLITIKKIIIYVIILSTLFLIIIAIPFEYDIITFASTTDAFKYSHMEKIIKEIKVTDGAYIIYEKHSDQLQCAYIKKIEDRWHYELKNSVSVVVMNKTDITLHSIGIVYIYKYTGTNCKMNLYFISIGLNDIGESINIRDPINSQFYMINYPYFTNKNKARYYYAVNKVENEKYSININGETINVE